MYLRQFFVDDLAHASYLVGCEQSKQAVVIDPERNVSVYLDEAKTRGLTITHVFETHLHADFVSGHMDLAKRCGAKIVLSKLANAAFPHQAVQGEEEIRIGTLLFKVLATPGHTPEGVCFLLTDTAKSKAPCAVFTGDTLFVGAVGRPDLFGPDRARELANQLYESLHKKLLTLPDEVEVYPAHGAGSFCGAGMGAERSSTIGREREMNCSFAGKSQKQFVDDLLATLPQTPTYFHTSAQVNRNGPALIGEKLPGEAIAPEKAHALLADGALPLDTRDGASFGEAHLPGSVHIAMGGQFASWAGWVTRPEDRFLFVLPSAADYPNAAWRLLRIGYDRIQGWLDGGVNAWRQKGLPIEVLPQITVEELARRLQSGEERPIVLDVRNAAEWKGGHIEGAMHCPANEISGKKGLPEKGALAVICAGGFRSSIASSLLARQGHRNLVNVVGGMGAWRKANLATTPAGKA